MLVRRNLLKAGLAWAGLASLPSKGWGQLAWRQDPFTMGVASGSPDSSSVVLWTRLDPLALEELGAQASEVDVAWQVAKDEKFSDIVVKGVERARPSLAHSVHAEVQGLQPDRTYFYRFIVGAAASPTGRTKTLAAANANTDRLRLAYASCQQWGNGYYSAYRHMANEELDFVLFLGDYIYEYPASLVPIRATTGGWITTLDGYRSRYALHKSDRDLQAAHAAFPWILTWDDHEVQNDYAGQFEGRSGIPVADFMARRRAAYQAFYEHMPVRRESFAKLLASESMEARLFDRVQIGKLATLCTLDDRQYRDRQVCNPDNRAGSSMVDPTHCPDLKNPARTLLGSEQETWLKQAFATSKTTWNLIGQQSVFGQRLGEVNGVTKVWNDGWDGYPASRQRFLNALQETKLSNPVLFGGDVHENWVGHIKADYNNPASASLGVEFCGTSITSLAGMKPEQAEKVLAANPHFIYAETRYRGYGVADISAQKMTTTLKAMQDATMPDSPAFDLAKFEVQAGSNRIDKL